MGNVWMMILAHLTGVNSNQAHVIEKRSLLGDTFTIGFLGLYGMNAAERRVHAITKYIISPWSCPERREIPHKHASNYESTKHADASTHPPITAKH